MRIDFRKRTLRMLASKARAHGKGWNATNRFYCHDATRALTLFTLFARTDLRNG